MEDIAAMLVFAIGNANPAEMEGNQEKQITKIGDATDTYSMRFKAFKKNNGETLRKVFSMLSPEDRKEGIQTV